MKDTKMLELFLQVNKLKKLKRCGWKRYGIDDGESVSDHSFHTALISMILSDALDLNIDQPRLLKMALVHDLAEVVTGDITPHDNIDESKRIEREKEAFRNLFRGLAKSEEYVHLFIDYQEQRSEEAKLVRSIDKLEMAIQAFEYEKELTKKTLGEFYRDAEKSIIIPGIVSLLIALKRLRKDIECT